VGRNNWAIRIRLDRFFDKQKALSRKLSDTEARDPYIAPVIRVRVEKGSLKDKILFAVYEKALKEEFSEKEINIAISEGYLIRQQIRLPNTNIRNVYCWTEKECEYQPIWYKRIVQNSVNWLKSFT